MTATMLHTARFGAIAYEDSHVLHLGGGLIGISDMDRVLVVQPGGTGPLYWLQSVDEPELAVVVADTAQVVPDYKPEIAAADLADLDLKRPEDALVLGVCVLASDPGASTINLRAPLIVNPVRRRGRQVLLDDERYSLRHPLLLHAAPAVAREA